MLIEVGAARQAIRDLAGSTFVAFPKTSDFITVLPVPFRPQHRKISDLIPAFADIPWLGDQFHLRKDRVLVNDVEKCVQFVHALVIARQSGCEVKSETVHVHVVYPIAQTVHNELKRARMKQIEGVSGPGEIQVEAGIVGR